MGIKTVFFDIGDTLVSEKKWVPGAKQLVMNLRAEKIAVGLISNTGDLDREKLAKLLPDDFEFELFREDLVFLSSEVGMDKRNLGLFSMAIQHAGNSPWEVMFVGESLEESLMAQRSGMRAARIAKLPEDFGKLAKAIIQKPTGDR